MEADISNHIKGILRLLYWTVRIITLSNKHVKLRKNPKSIILDHSNKMIRREKLRPTNTDVTCSLTH